LAIYFLVMALRINWNTARYQKMSDMSVGLFLMGTLWVTPGATRTAELSDVEIRDEQQFDGWP
jgi:hypothetical protein